MGQPYPSPPYAQRDSQQISAPEDVPTDPEGADAVSASIGLLLDEMKKLLQQITASDPDPE